MKRSIVFTFIFLYLVAMARPILPLMEYVVYEDYIAEFLCINKDNKELECHGKCYLMQRIQEQNDEKQENLPKIVMEEYPIGFVQLLNFSSSTIPTINPCASFNYVNPYSYLFVSESFHPPSVYC
ncbi:hypothetical protein [Flagellimonas sp.]|uniref:hypothetical protein n=1 Tax=Flagellimonas sp. TaxID=2058762 RepID=UPI003F49CA12